MSDDDDLQLVVPLVLRGIIAKDAVEQCFRDHTAYRKAGKPYSLLAVMIKNGVLTKTQAFVLKGASLVDLQPFPDYKFLRHVGEGGMADVYEATYLETKTRVALKVLKTDFCLQEPYRLRFRREAKIVELLDHENIVEGKEYRSHDGVDFYAMGFVDGVSVLDILDSGVSLREGMALHIAAQVASALEHMRQKGIVHRDVKPGNLVIDSDGAVKIIDFGFAKVMSGMRQDTGEETTVGTVEYMSPEQARGATDIDSRADVYSLGATLFHMATGDLPFTGATPAEVMHGHVKRPLEITEEQQARLSVATIFIVRKAMAKSPAERYDTPQQMFDDIQALCGPQIAARGPVPAVVHEASVEAAPITLPAPKPTTAHRRHARPHSRIHRRPHR